MASGYWETRYSPSGYPYKVWISTPAPKKKKATGGDSAAKKRARAKAAAAKRAADAARRKAAAQRAKARAAAAAKRAAAARAKAKAAAAARARVQAQARAAQIAAAKARAAAHAKALADARRKAYEAVQRQQKAIANRAGLIAQKNNDRAKTSSSGVTRPAAILNTGNDERAERQAKANAVRAAEANIIAAENKKKQATHWKEYQYKWQKKVVLDSAKAGDGKSAGEIERIILEEAARAAKNGTADSNYLRTLNDKYEAHAERVYQKWEELVASFNAQAEKGNEKEMKRIWYSPDFMRYRAEFTRLFGNGKNPLKDGDYGKTKEALGQIAYNQREWWKRQMKASLQSDLKTSVERGGAGGEYQQKLQQQLGIFNSTKVGMVQDGYETYVDENGKKRTRPKYRKRTIDEEIDHQRALITMKNEELASKYAATVRQQKADAVKHGMVLHNDQYVKRKDLDIIKDAERVVAEQFGGEAPQIKRAEDLSKFADTMMGDWEKRNPQPENWSNNALGLWYEKRQAYEKEIYRYFGSSAPEWWDRVFQTPGISNAFAVLQGGASAIGAGARVAAKVLGGPSSTYFAPTMSEAPPDIRAELKGKGAAETNQIWQAFITSTRGKKWLADHRAAFELKSQQEDAAFNEGFYDWSGKEGKDGIDLGARLDALNAYGSNPSNDPGANLLFNLLADPFNAIPLKFTTYAARGKFANDATQGLKISKPGIWAKKFLTVDEGTLKIRKELEAAEKELAQSGWSLDKATDVYRERVAGITQKTARELEFKKIFRTLGLDPRKVNESQLFNLIERVATQKVRPGALLTQAAEQAEAVRLATKQASEKRAASAAARAAEKKKLEAPQDKAYKEGKIAQANLAEARIKAEGVPKKPIVTEALTPAAAKKLPVGKRLAAALPDRKQPYFKKDVEKSSDANKFIGIGAPGSSTSDYAKALGGSDTVFEAGDTVFVSANGNRVNRVRVLDRRGNLTQAYRALDDAVRVRATIKTDVPIDRERGFNVGEREVAEYLTKKGYVEVAPGRWEDMQTPLARRAAEMLGERPPRNDAFTGQPVDDFADEYAEVMGRRDRDVDFDSDEMAESLGLPSREEINADYAKQQEFIGRRDEAFKTKEGSPVYSDIAWEGTAHKPEFYQGNTFVHYTTAEGAAGIRSVGFNIEAGNSPFYFGGEDSSTVVPALGRGVYFSGGPFWKETDKAALVPVAMKLADDIRILPITSYDQVEALAKEFGVKVPYYGEDYLELMDAIRASGKYDGVSIVNLDNWEKIYKGTGRPDKSMRGLSGDQIVVWDPKRVEIVGPVDTYLAPDAPSVAAASDVHVPDPDVPLTEQEWWDAQKTLANDVLLNKSASRAEKIAARQRLSDIKAAEYAVKVEKGRGTYVPWEQRAAFQRRVVKAYGKDAEGYIADKMIAPKVSNAGEAAVEQVRTYWAQLQTAEATPAFSRVRGIKIKGKDVDHIPKDVWDELEQLMAKGVAEARGWTADTLTRGRKPGTNLESHKPLGKLSDDDPIVIRAKQRVLREYAQSTGVEVSINAYDEVRKALWRGYVQNRTALQLLSRAQKKAAKTGRSVDDVYLELRTAAAKREARKQLAGIAHTEMYGHSPASIFSEFVARYSDDGTLKHFVPSLTPIQKATLEAHARTIAGMENLDSFEFNRFLQSANRPPFHSRELTREFLKKIGAWSPRRAEEFVAGAKSWDIWEEATYWRVHYGEVPDWTNPAKLERKFGQIFHDENMYYAQMKTWGIFSRSMELRLKLDGKSAAEIEKAIFEGNPDLNIPARRELELQRRYVIERYGKLVSEDGESLISMPWLMYPDEYRKYLSTEMAKSLPEDMIQNVDELAEVEKLINKALDHVWEKYIDVDAADGAVSMADIFRVASEVQMQLIANPKWARRKRDWLVGKPLGAWGWTWRWAVFSNPSFFVTNAVDAPIKGAYYRFTRRGLFNASMAKLSPEMRARVEALTPSSVGFDATTAMYREKQAGALSRLQNPRGFSDIERAADRAMAVIHGTGELFPFMAGNVELYMKMKLVRDMYPTVYEEAFRRFGNEELADAFAKNFAKEEASRMWPTAGSGPIEQLWNRLVPFSTYSVRNKILFISEAIGHPAILNYIQDIGNYIEQENLKQWELKYPGFEMPEYLRRRISLPWAPDLYLDLATFSDSARGIKPIFDLGKEKKLIDHVAQWVRIVNPGAQALAYAMMNAANVGQKIQWVPIYKDGYPTGKYEMVTRGWLEPWSDREADFSSVFWFGEAFRSAQAYGADNWPDGTVTQMLGQVFLFNGISAVDRGAVYASFFFSLADKNKAQAEKWLNESEEGKYAKDWLEEKGKEPRDAKDLLRDMERAKKDTAPWFHSQTKEFQEKVKKARDEIRLIRDGYWAEINTLTPGTKEYKDMKARMYLAINNVYLNNPELLMANIFGKTPDEFSAQLEDWQSDKLMDDFMSMNSQRPQRADYDSAVTYNTAVAVWETAKRQFLFAYPQVAEKLNSGIKEIDAARDKMNSEWDKILDRIGDRNGQIDIAKEILETAGRDSKAGRNAQDRLDALYLANELDYTLLERDYAADYFTPDDYQKLPKGIIGPTTLKGNVIERVTVLMDFDRTRYEKARVEGTLDEFMAQQQYGQDMKKATLYAKGGDPFGEFDGEKFFNYMQKNPKLRELYFDNNPGKEAEWAKTAWYIEGIRSYWRQAGDDAGKWVRLMKSNPKLLAEYFRRNPGKREQWAANDHYIRNIAVWGKLIGAGRWDEAAVAWDNLPMSVKLRYLNTHPGTKMTLSGDFKGGGGIKYGGQFFKSIESRDRYIAGKKYFDAISPWGKAAAAGDWDAADAIWAKLPQWVKDRYRSNNPKKGQSLQTVNYLGYMKKWVSMFEKGDKKGAMAYFNSLPQWAKERYYKKHPEKRAEFELSDKMSRKLIDYFAGDDKYRSEYLAKNPDLVKWLAKNGGKKANEFATIMAAYRKIPADEAWLRRVFREKYPEVFSQEAAGKRRLKRVYDTLSRHPDVLDEFEVWMEKIVSSYEEMLKHPIRPMNSFGEMVRKTPGRKVKKSLSAEEADRISMRGLQQIRNPQK